jgi:hypothetical protein
MARAAAKQVVRRALGERMFYLAKRARDRVRQLTTLTTRLRRSLYSPALGRYGKSPCLWSKGISQICNFNGPAWYWLDATESCQSEPFFSRHYAGAHGLVWVRLSTLSRNGARCDLDNFVRTALPNIRRPFALITTDGDVSVPSELPGSTVEALLESPWLVSWNTQNHDGYVHPKLAPIPIGLDLHTPRPRTSPRRLVSLLQNIRRSRLPVEQLPLRVFCDLGLSPWLERRNATSALLKCDHVDFLSSRLSQEAIWRCYAQYPFVLSARGNGLDCHRTWELLYLGCIVITKSSSLDPLFSELPVVIVEDWREVRQNANLAKWLERYGSLTGHDYIWQRLEPGHFLQSIRQAVEAANAPSL